MGDFTLLGSISTGHPLRAIAQYLFFIVVFCAMVFVRSTEAWAGTLLAILLGICCLLESSVSRDFQSRLPRWLMIAVGAAFAWILLTLCPWPSSWARWLSPGQQAILTQIDFSPHTLRLSMDSHATWRALFKIIGFCVVCYLTWIWSSSRSFRNAIGTFILLLSVVAATFGVVDYFDGGAVFGAGKPGGLFHWGVFNNRNHFANFVNVGAFMGIGIFFRAAFPRRNQRRARMVALIALVGSCFCGALSVSTSSRGGILFLLAGLAVALLVLIIQKRFGLRLQVLLLGVVISSALVLTYGRTAVKRTEVWLRGGQTQEADGRTQVWRDSIRMAHQMGARGIGVGAFETVFPIFKTGQGDKTVTHAENEYVQAYAEWGIIGSLVLLFLLFRIVSYAIRTLDSHSSEWQIAGWAALAGMAAHATVDFPFHIPANSWLVAMLLGVLARGHLLEDERAPVEEEPVFSWRRMGLRSVAVLLVAGSFLWTIPSSSKIISTSLDQLHFKAAFEKSQGYVEEWPFYWYAHELRGFAAAGMPSMNRETQRSLRRAQQLSPWNSNISYHAGTLFLMRDPGIALDFFEHALLTSARPDILFTHILHYAAIQPGGFVKIAPLAMRTPQRWRTTWGYLNAVMPRGSKVIQIWTEEGAAQWLEEASNRELILAPLVYGGLSTIVLKSLETTPPQSKIEDYWRARALIEIKSYQTAAVVLKAMVLVELKQPPTSLPNIELSERLLRRAMMDPANLGLQREVAEALAREGRFPEAATCWERILTSRPKDTTALYGLASAYEGSGNWDKAAGLWQALVEHLAKIVR